MKKYQIIKVVASLGVGKVELTGKGPLIRNGVVKIMKRISNINGISEVSITTNGVFFGDFVRLKEAGLARVNVNLRFKFKNI